MNALRLPTPKASPAARIHLCGDSAVLMDVSVGAFDLQVQRRLWACAGVGGALRQVPGVTRLVVGVNNVLVHVDPLSASVRQLDTLADALQQAWRASKPASDLGRLLQVPVAYDLTEDSELTGIAQHAGLSKEQVVRLHTSVEYHVACIGAAPGFVYLVGLPPQLATPRHTVPRAKVLKGTVAIGGAQTGIMPMDMPSGWRALGHTQIDLFNPHRAEPCLLRPGDRVRFTVAAA